MESPAYSNIAFQLLSYAVEEATGQYAVAGTGIVRVQYL
jgi:hypothetical protein